jgi:TM2 domain-containing membrane protein YozV
MATKIVKCSKCNAENTGLENFCRNCGTTLDDPFQNHQNPQQQQMQQPFNQNTGSVPGADKKLAAGICGILLGGFGVHKFIMGYQNEGIILLAVYLVGIVLTMITCGIAFPILLVPSVVGIIEGIIYLTKSDEEFVQTYVNNKKPWF